MKLLGKSSRFQFHKGTIRTPESSGSLKLSLSFQFHKGTIRTEKPGSEPEARIKFQFHKGTIRTLDAYGVENPYSIISIP